MGTFIPPTEQGYPLNAAEKEYTAADRLLRFYPGTPVGVTIWKDQGGVWHQSSNPYEPDLAAAQKFYLGGHTYTITAAEAEDLIAGGFINITATNVIQGPCSFESGIGTWTPATANCQADLTAGVATHGSNSMKVTRLNTNGILQLFNATSGTINVPCVPGDTPHVWYDIRCPFRDVVGRVTFRYYNAARGSLGDQLAVDDVTIPTDTWGTVKVQSPAAPANAAFCNVALQTNTNLIVGEYAYMDKVALSFHNFDTWAPGDTL